MSLPKCTLFRQCTADRPRSVERLQQAPLGHANLRAKSGTAQADAEALGGREFHEAARVVEVGDIVFRVRACQFVRALPQRLGVAQPECLLRSEGAGPFGGRAHASILAPMSGRE